MPATLELLDKALEVNPSGAFWCKEMHVARTTLSQARTRGRLSPTVAGNLALLLGGDERYWVAIAGLEAEPDTDLRDTLLSRASNWRKRSHSNRHR